ncbi:MAG: peptidoglycan editing factor PgeF [Candidatus Moranbacteria bacterium]|nr:peptidoglycan editing factor PgeF [Candidatus Moranbacteria bacterium]
MIKFFGDIPELIAVMSERKDGSMRLSKDSNLNLKNRAIFFEKIGIIKNKMIAAGIVHGTNVRIADSTSPEMILGADGLVTNDKNVFLSITVADCFPVYFFESEHKIIAIVHCGWRGIVGGIIKNAIEKISELGGKAESLRAAIGPGIDKCHFEIKEDVLDEFNRYTEFVIRKKDKTFVDLKGVIKRQLSDSNINLENVDDNSECTVENNRYFSYRNDKPEVIEAMVAVIGLVG